MSRTVQTPFPSRQVDVDLDEDLDLVEDLDNRQGRLALPLPCGPRLVVSGRIVDGQLSLALGGVS